MLYLTVVKAKLGSGGKCLKSETFAETGRTSSKRVQARDDESPNFILNKHMKRVAQVVSTAIEKIML